MSKLNIIFIDDSRDRLISGRIEKFPVSVHRIHHHFFLRTYLSFQIKTDVPWPSES